MCNRIWPWVWNLVPFFADQPFWGDRVHRLGAGPPAIPFSRLSVKKLAQAIDISVNDPTLRKNASNLGERLQAEDRVGKAVRNIQAYLETSYPVPGSFS